MPNLDSNIGEQPFARKRYLDIDGHRMAYIDEGEGAPIVFQHGSPTSSYLWRNVMPACAGLGRLIACDLMGFGDSDKLDPSLGRERYSYQAQRKYLFALWEELRLDRDVIMVVHDIGSIYGFDWASQHRQRVQGIAYMESLVAPLEMTDFPASVREAFGKALTAQGRDAALNSLGFVDQFLLGAREFSELEQAIYRKPFLIPGEERRPFVGTEFSVGGTPADTACIMADYSAWLAETDIPKLLINADPGFILNGRLLELARTWKNQTEITVSGTHFVQENSPYEIGLVVADFVRQLRSTPS